MRRTIAALQPLWQGLVFMGYLFIIGDVAGLIDPPGGLIWVSGVVVVLVVGPALMSVGPDADVVDPEGVASPVRGRWMALNTPGQQMPSHGTQGLGQLSAVDIIRPDEGDEVNPPAMRRGWRGSRPEQFRCFGAEIYAMASGVVVEVSDIQPDQRARNTWQSMIWFSTVENILRVLAGWRVVIGNRVVIAHRDGVYSAYAHLKRGSAEVSVGDHVLQGQLIAAVGNTGNTTQPHLHVQLMDRARFPAAAGLPMIWPGIELGEIHPVWQQYAKDPGPIALEAMPRNGQIFHGATGADSVTLC